MGVADVIKLVLLALFFVACLATLFVDIGPAVDPLIDPSIDPNNVQGLGLSLSDHCFGALRKCSVQPGAPEAAQVECFKRLPEAVYCVSTQQMDRINSRCRPEVGAFAYCAGPLALGRGGPDKIKAAQDAAAVNCASQASAMEACKAQVGPDAFGH